MKKYILFFLLCLVTLASGQLTTNTLTVVLDASQVALIQTVWNYDNGLRTNGFPPYLTTTNAQTFRQFVEGINNNLLTSLAAQTAASLQGQRESEMLRLWRLAPVSKQVAAMAALQ